MAIQTKGARTSLICYHPWTLTAGTWKYPTWKKEDYGYKPPSVGFQLSSFRGCILECHFSVDLWEALVRFQHSESPAIQMVPAQAWEGLPWGEGEIFVDKKVNSSKKTPGDSSTIPNWCMQFLYINSIIRSFCRIISSTQICLMSCQRQQSQNQITTSSLLANLRKSVRAPNFQQKMFLALASSLGRCAV